MNYTLIRSWFCRIVGHRLIGSGITSFGSSVMTWKVCGRCKRVVEDDYKATQ